METKQILFTDFNKAELVEVEVCEPNENEVVVEIEFSSISCGTEKALVSGNQNINTQSKEGCEIKFPRSSGYSSAGTVLKLLKRTAQFSIQGICIDTIRIFQN